MDDAGQGPRNEAPRGPVAVVRGRITMLEQTLARVAANTVNKGDVLGTARFAGRQAAKDVASLVALASSVQVRTVSIDFRLGSDAIDIEAMVESRDGGDVTMAAFVAVSAAALTIYDMCKSADRTMVIGPVQLRHE